MSSAIDSDMYMVLGKEIPIESSTISDSALQLIKCWLGQCENKHPGCRTDQVQFPTRLIYLEARKSRIVDTLSIPKRPRYLALSHCWGTIKLMRLLKANSQDMHARIQEDDLCQTFKDALYITRALGFYYIWIDSLCIIQDDPDDWRKEASKMCGVYSGSTLTLAASSAPDGSYGCLRNRSPETLRRIRRYSIPIPVNGISRMYDFLDLKLHEENIQKSPLSTRGWVLQERVLSPRTLHFTDMQLYWECNEKIACETFQEKLHYTEPDDLTERTNHRALWASIVHHYTRRNLKYGSDKLIAMSGMAQWVHHQTGDQYLAGLWKKSLELQLIWEFEGSHGQYFEGRAPSWSWAAYDGAIDMLDQMPTASRFLVSLVATEIYPVGDDLYGPVASGKLRLEVPLLLGVTLRFDHTRTRIKDCGLLSNGKPNPVSIAEDKREYSQWPLEWYCLPILEIDDGEDKLFSGLMVEATKDGVRGQFRRVGNFRVGQGQYGDSKFPKRHAKFVSAMRDPKCWAERSVFEPSEQKTLYNSKKDKLYITLV